MAKLSVLAKPFILGGGHNNLLDRGAVIVVDGLTARSIRQRRNLAVNSWATARICHTLRSTVIPCKELSLSLFFADVIKYKKHSSAKLSSPTVIQSGI